VGGFFRTSLLRPGCEQKDVLGNLKKVVLPDGKVIEYLVDGRNRRVGKKVNGVIEKQWIYDGQLRPVAEMNSAGTVTATYIYATHINVPDYVVKGTTTYRVITDHLGSLRFVINTSNGTIAQRIDYDDWGNVLVNTAPDWTPFGFAGGIYDKDTKLTRFGARDYDAEVGRWTSKDPILFKGLQANLYSYTLNDPVNIQDFSGNSGCVGQCIKNLRQSLKFYKAFQTWFTPISALSFGGLAFTAFLPNIPASCVAGGVGLVLGGMGTYYGAEWAAAILGEKQGLRKCLTLCLCDSEGLKQEMIEQLTNDIYEMVWNE
jgi:RHS repeat-associated protein